MFSVETKCVTKMCPLLFNVIMPIYLADNWTKKDDKDKLAAGLM